MTDTRKATPIWQAENKQELGKWQEKRRLATALRNISTLLAEKDVPEATLAQAADDLERLGNALRPLGPLDRSFKSIHPEHLNEASVGAFFDQNPVLGLANPVALPCTLGMIDEKTFIANARFSSAYEGSMGNVHGGYIAAVFDDVLGFTQAIGGQPGVTGTLSLKYLQPTPINKEVIFESRYLGNEGRKNFTEATARVGGTLVAECEAVFITPDKS